MLSPLCLSVLADFLDDSHEALHRFVAARTGWKDADCLDVTAAVCAEVRAAEAEAGRALRDGPAAPARPPLAARPRRRARVLRLA